MRNRPRPDQIASILRDFQADLDAGLNLDQACRKAGIGPTTYYRWKAFRRTPYRVNNFAFQNSRPRSIGSSSWSPSWRSTVACSRRP